MATTTIIVWYFYIMVLNPNTHQGTLVRHEYDTQIKCIHAAVSIAKGFNWKSSPDCKQQEKLVKGQNT